MKTYVHHNPLVGNSGFTLVEVLVTLVILSIGLLGLAGLQLTSLRDTHTANLRTLSALQAYDMSDRMRANTVGISAGAYNNPTAAQAPDCLTTTGCNAAAMAGHDFYEWNTANGNLLPDGGGTVCIDSDPADASACDNLGSLYAITVSWTERERSGPITKSFAVSFKP